MPEVAHISEHHGDAMFICCGDDFIVAYGATRLNDGANAHGSGGIYTIAKGEKGI